METSAVMFLNLNPRLFKHCLSSVAVLKSDVILPGRDPKQTELLARRGILCDIGFLLILNRVRKPAGAEHSHIGEVGLIGKRDVQSLLAPHGETRNRSVVTIWD